MTTLNRTFLEQLQHTARSAAFQGGQIIHEKNSSPRKIKFKGLRDLVTDTDTAAQAAILRVILERYPDHQILAEEDPASHPDEQGRWHIPAGIVWIIDPLDGTSNYANGLPMVSVSIGVVVDGEPVIGAIYDPLRKEMFEGGYSLGASLNGRPIPKLTPNLLENAIICLDWGREPEIRRRAVESAAALAANCRTLRSFGSTALGLAYTAAGRIQAYFNFGMQPWDCAAGTVMIREAGGDLRKPAGGNWKLGERAILTGHPSVLDEAGPRIRAVITS